MGQTARAHNLHNVLYKKFLSTYNQKTPTLTQARGGAR